MPLSVLQSAGANDRMMLIVLGVIALLTLVVLGLKFFRNLFEIITAPGASLKFHGQTDNFFYSLLLVFLGALISVAIMVANQDKIVEAYSHYSNKVAADLGAANSNKIYQPVAEEYARKRLDDNFNIYFVQNMIMLPMVFVAVWFVLGSLVFLFPKMFQSTVAWADMLGTTAYASFFFSIGVGLAAPFIVDFIASKAGASAPTPDAMGIAGCVLMLYGLVLFLMGIAAAAEISSGQVIAVVLFLAIVLGGVTYYAYDSSRKAFAVFSGKVTSFNPAVGKGIE
jgi:Yip1 domain